MKVVWHRRDLRTFDNMALSKAGDKALPVYIFDPEWLENNLVSDARIKFVLESLKDLNRQYVEKDSHLTLLHGNPVEILTDLSDEGHEIFFNKDANHFKQERERKAREKFHGFENSAVDTSGRDQSEWSKNTEKWFQEKYLKPSNSLVDNNLESSTSLEEIKDRYSIEPEKEVFGVGGSSEARNRLENFLNRIESYSGCISSPSKAEASTSHLSPYIRYGCISIREVYQKAKERKKETSDTQSVEMFMDRLFWQQHFNQKIEDNPKLFKEAINPVYQELNKENNDNLVKAWKKGKTGFPLIDASMRALKQTGWLNFRMRAMSASFFSYILKQWWKTGADHFYKHLIDADVAINYYQWQMQSGLVGVHANRIYNPTKQVKDNDPKGKFIKKYVPELRPVPQKYIAQPWKMPENIQEKTNTVIGKNYPEPIVNYQREAKKARKFFKQKSSEAYKAFEKDKVWKKASLSSKHDREEILEKADIPQSNLSEF
jgi:deoxyribodipyrimidine photo-lyase